jgi:DNA-binding HxlR family transcriptional regulator
MVYTFDALRKYAQLSKPGELSFPRRVTYYLTKAGEALIPMITKLYHWGTRHLGISRNLPMIHRAATLNLSPRRTGSRPRKSIAA